MPTLAGSATQAEHADRSTIGSDMGKPGADHADRVQWSTARVDGVPAEIRS
jgi:hypothetical protein